MAKRIRTWDDYFIPGTTVLKNKLGIVDPVHLQEMEERFTWLRAVELRTRPVEPRFDYEHMKSIHGYLFQDVYDWAGQQRVGPDNKMTKAGPDVLNFAPGDPKAPVVAYGYYAGPQVTEAAERQYALLAKEHQLQGLGKEQFIERLADHWGELNTIHSFREGNTRTQFIFFEQLAANAGYHLDVVKFEPGQRLRDDFVWARFHNQATASTDRLASVLSEAISAEGSVSHDVGTAGDAVVDSGLRSLENLLTQDRLGTQPMGTEQGETYGPISKSSSTYRAPTEQGHELG